MSATELAKAVNHAKAFGGSGMIVRSGYRVAFWGDQTRRYNLYSATKSIGSILLGLALSGGKLQLTDRVQAKLPELRVVPTSSKAAEWLPLITVEQLATHTAGFEKPGGFGKLLFKPGMAWSYSDGGVNWLADLVTVTFGQDLAAVLRNRVLQYLKVSTTDLTWRTNIYRPPTLRSIPRREFNSGISANMDAMARIGLLMARGGMWESRRILPESYVRAARSTPSKLAKVPLFDSTKWPTAPRRYGLLNRAGIPGGSFVWLLTPPSRPPPR